MMNDKTWGEEYKKEQKRMLNTGDNFFLIIFKINQLNIYAYILLN